MNNKIWNIIKESVGFISSIITILLLVIKLDKYAFWLGMFTIFWIGIYIFVPIIQIFRTRRAKKRLWIEYIKSNTKYGKKIHKFLHKLRDYATDIDINNAPNWTELKKSCEVLCASICEIMEQIFNVLLDGNNISTCIKVVNSDSLVDTDYENWMIEMLGRSPSTDPERSGIDFKKTKLSENTDFLAIVQNKDTIMSFNNMNSIFRDFPQKYNMQYINPRGANFINYYRSCIIIPIEIDGDKASSEIKEKIRGIINKKLLLGFLCIDSMKTFDTEEEIIQFESAIEIAKALGDSLYIFLEKVLICQIHCKDNNEEIQERN